MATSKKKTQKAKNTKSLKLLTLVIIAMLSGMAFIALVKFPATVKADQIAFADFEEGNVSDFSGGTSGTVGVETAQVYAGSYSANLSSSGNGDPAIGQLNYTLRNETWIKFVWRPVDIDMAVSAASSVAGLNNTALSNIRFELDVYNNAGNYILQGYLRTDSGEQGAENDTFFISVDNWYVVKIYYIASAVDGGADVYINGSKTLDMTAYDLDDYGQTDQVFLKQHFFWGSGDWAQNSYYDNLGVYDADPDLEEGDTTAPTYSALSTSSLQAGTICKFNATFDDNVALESNGQAIFETNNTGTWTADSPVNFTSTPQTLSVSKTLNSTVGDVVSYRWNFTDNAGNSNTTGIQNSTLTGTNSYPDYYATSTDYDDVQTAIDYVYTNWGNGTVHIPAGTSNWNTFLKKDPDNANCSVLSYGGINVTGAGIGVTVFQQTTQPPEPTAMFVVDGRNNKSFTISYITFQGYTGYTDDNLAISGLGLAAGKDYRVHHCAFDSFPQIAVGCGNWGNEGVGTNRGLIDHCTFDNSYKEKSGDFSWGYGVVISDNDYSQWSDMDSLIGQYEGARDIVYIEDCNFANNRHAFANSQNGYFVVRYCNIVNGSFAPIDVHGFNGGRGCEAYNNTVYEDSGWYEAVWLRGGTSTVFNNTFVDFTTGVRIYNETADGHSGWDNGISDFRNEVWDTYIWGNTMQGGGTAFSIGSGDYIENTDYFLYARPSYTSYPYPHPFVSGEEATYYTLTMQASTGGTTSPSVGEHSILSGVNQTIIASASSGYSFVDWEIDGANQTATATWHVEMDSDHTAKAYFIANTYPVSLTVTNPTATTYQSGASNIPISLSASSNGTGTVITWNIKFTNGSWLYVSNQTYSAPTTATINDYANHTSVLFCSKAVNNEGFSDYKEVTFNVQYVVTYSLSVSWTTPEATTYTSSIVNFEASASGNETGVTYQINLFNASVQVYGSNFTSASGSFTGLVNGTYTAAVYVEGDHGEWDYAEVEFAVEIITTNWYGFTSINFKDLANGAVLTTTWKLYNASDLLTYTLGQYTLVSGTYTLKTYLAEQLINSTDFDTDTYGNSSLTIYLQLAQGTTYSIAVNGTVTSLEITSENSTHLLFSATGEGSFTIVIPSERNATYISKDGVNQTYGEVWTYDSVNQAIIITTDSLSDWEIMFAENPEPTSTPYSNAISQLFTNAFIVFNLLSIGLIVFAAFLITRSLKGDASSEVITGSVMFLITSVALLVIGNVVIATLAATFAA